MKLIAPNERMSGWLEQVWLQRYLERKLEEDETEWFEMYILDKSELIAIIEADNDVRDGMVSANRTLAAPAFVPSKRRRVGMMPRISPALAWAASVIACIGLGWLLALRFSSVPSDPTLDVVASPTRIVYDTLRGVDSRPQIYQGSPESEYVLVEVGLPSEAKDIRAQVGASIHRPLVLSTDGFVGLLLKRSTIDAATKITISYELMGERYTRTVEAWPTI